MVFLFRAYISTKTLNYKTLNSTKTMRKIFVTPLFLERLKNSSLCFVDGDKKESVFGNNNNNNPLLLLL